MTDFHLVKILDEGLYESNVVSLSIVTKLKQHEMIKQY